MQQLNIFWNKIGLFKMNATAYKTETKLPEFKGSSIELKTPYNFPTGDFGKAVLKEHQERARADFPNARGLNALAYDEEQEVVTGSNPPSNVLLNMILGQEGLRTSSQADIEKVLKLKALRLNGRYIDTGLILRSKCNPNEYLAGNLMSQIREISPKAKMPAMIPLHELELTADSSSPYGFAFKIKENAQIFYDLSVLNKGGHFSSEDIDLQTGLPKKTGNNGNRELYTRDSGLSGLYLDGDSGVISDGDDLDNSDGNGRVVVVSAGGAAENLEKYVSQLKQEANQQKVEIDKRFSDAKALLIGKR